MTGDSPRGPVGLSSMRCPSLNRVSAFSDPFLRPHSFVASLVAKCCVIREAERRSSPRASEEPVAESRVLIRPTPESCSPGDSVLSF